MAADAVRALKCKAGGALIGEATGDDKLHLDALIVANVEIMLSGMSAKACGYDSWTCLCRLPSLIYRLIWTGTYHG